MWVRNVGKAQPGHSSAPRGSGCFRLLSCIHVTAEAGWKSGKDSLTYRVSLGSSKWLLSEESGMGITGFLKGQWSEAFHGGRFPRAEEDDAKPLQGSA